MGAEKPQSHCCQAQQGTAVEAVGEIRLFAYFPQCFLPAQKQAQALGQEWLWTPFSTPTIQLETAAAVKAAAGRGEWEGKGVEAKGRGLRE